MHCLWFNFKVDDDYDCYIVKVLLETRITTIFFLSELHALFKAHDAILLTNAGESISRSIFLLQKLT